MNRIYLALLLCPLLAQTALAVPGLQTRMTNLYPQLKNSPLDSCITCHFPTTSGFLNQFGQDLASHGNSFEAVSSLDSDADGLSNEQELTAAGFPSSTSTDPDIFIFNNKMGQIKFNHRAHIANPGYQINGNCPLCHEGPKHFPKNYDDAVTIKFDAHSTCWKCHSSHKETRPRAPQLCKDCHNRDIKETN